MVVDVTPSAFGSATMLVRGLNENGAEIDRFTLLALVRVTHSATRMQ